MPKSVAASAPKTRRPRVHTQYSWVRSSAPRVVGTEMAPTKPVSSPGVGASGGAEKRVAPMSCAVARSREERGQERSMTAGTKVVPSSTATSQVVVGGGGGGCCCRETAGCGVWRRRRREGRDCASASASAPRRRPESRTREKGVTPLPPRCPGSVVEWAPGGGKRDGAGVAGDGAGDGAGAGGTAGERDELEE